MYQSHFGLRQEPFGMSPDPAFFFHTAQHLEAAASLYASVVQRRGFAALIARPGTGKTTVIAAVRERLRSEADVVAVVHPELAGTALLESILIGLGLEPCAGVAANMRQLSEHLLQLDRCGRTCAVIIDEAQNLSPAALESVRMLSNLEMPDRKLIQFLLVGQPRLSDVLSDPSCEQVRQRLSVVARLEPLSPGEVRAYIEHRLAVAGCPAGLFTPAAYEDMAAASGGVPRLIHTLGFNALTIAYALGRHIVTRADVAEAASDIGLEWKRSAGADIAPPPVPAPAFLLTRSGSNGALRVALVLLTLGAVISGLAWGNLALPDSSVLSGWNALFVWLKGVSRS